MVYPVGTFGGPSFPSLDHYSTSLSVHLSKPSVAAMTSRSNAAVELYWESRFLKSWQASSSPRVGTILFDCLTTQIH